MPFIAPMMVVAWSRFRKFAVTQQYPLTRDSWMLECFSHHYGWIWQQ